MAVDELLDEHEQGERVRQWVRENALGVFAGIAVALGLVWGFQQWQAHQLEQRMAQGDAYAAVNASIAAGDLDKARDLAAAAELNDGAFAALLALDLAKAQVDAGDTDAAIATLAALTDPGPALEPVVARRLASLHVAAGKADEALAVLGDAADAGSLETRGDALVVAGRTDDARAAYTAALAALDVAAVPQRRILEIKLIDAGGVPAHTEGNAR
ncbi:tetratricopeptide repeat protein [Luteimonas sp. MC1825]|uniref:YfgM family protein n=1 Tax=Luteimonas sp. MC1825 TaxID=2761107 RepID=UPI00161CC592|nr:tetratricopeptide repeat protein [Luteimonas sp. MC1825]MBB6599252.1 tetratricopeptide repeat protein [Luteimonas sp. MC1825]QOC89367.1 tetratricopeptide repeat protein [Luteimonas sp. MC1825]